MSITWTEFYPATVGELRKLLADLPENMFVSSYDDYCLQVQISEDDDLVVFDHGCRVDQGYGPWEEDE